MNNRIDTYLCIGGVLDGQRYDCQGNCFKVAPIIAAQDIKPDIYFVDHINPSSQVCENVLYIKDKYTGLNQYGDIEEITFFRPDKLSPIQALHLLLKNYRPVGVK